MNILNNKGISLIETILFIAIFGALFSVLSGVVVHSLALKDQNEVVARVNEEGSFAMHKIVELIENGDVVLTPNSGEGSTLIIDVYNTAQDTEISLNGTQIEIDDGPGGAVPLTSSLVSVDLLSFEVLSRTTDVEIIKINLTISATNAFRGNINIFTQDFYSSASTRSYDRN